MGECSPAGSKISCGVDCDGGGMLAERSAKPGKILMSFGDYYGLRMTMGCGEDEEGDTVMLEPGEDDKEFLLSEKSACPPMTSGRARTLPAHGASKPTFLWVPSQNGFFDEWPQRQNQAFSTRSTLRPVPDSTSSLPVTISGPFGTGFTIDRAGEIGDRERAFLGQRLAARDEAAIDVGVVAERLVARQAAAAERGAKRDLVAVDAEVGMEGQRPVLAHDHDVGVRRLLVGAAILARHMDRAGRTVVGDMQQRLGIGGIGVDPRPLDIGPEDMRLAHHAAPRMDAAMAVES